MGQGALAARDMKFEVSHRTSYQYRTPVAQSHHVIHLKPRALPLQTVIHHSLLIEPAPVSSTETTDFFGNAVVLLRIEEEHTEFVVHARSTVEVRPSPPPDIVRGPTWEDVANSADGATASSMPMCASSFAARGMCRSAMNSALRARLFPPRRPVLDGAMHLTRRIFEDFTFDPKATDVSTPVARVLEMRARRLPGLRTPRHPRLAPLGIPARYVSGYLMTRPPPGQVKLKGADASHAWLSVWSGEQGWVDFDPTNGIIPKGEHITLAYGRDYDDISPISGVLLGGGDQTMSVAVDVEPVG